MLSHCLPPLRHNCTPLVVVALLGLSTPHGAWAKPAVPAHPASTSLRALDATAATAGRDEATLMPAARIVAAPTVAAKRGNVQIASFRAAKTLLTILYAEHPYTLYSNCHFDAQAHTVDYGECAYQPRRDNERATRIEWEHIVPAEAFGASFGEWRTGDARCSSRKGAYKGRRCASRANADFRRIEADLYNLVPEIGEINQLRSNKPMAEVLASDCQPLADIGGCVGHKHFTPRHEAKGDVARAHLYMAATYPELHLLSPQKRQLFVAWAEQDPVDAWECRRAFRIEGLQGNENGFVKAPCLAAHLWPQLATYSHR